MRKLTTIVFCLISYLSNAQLHNAQWVIGDYWICNLDFRADTVRVDSLLNAMAMDLTCANICDENGDLLYRTNGIFIADANGDTLINGSGINPCQYTIDNVARGLTIYEAALFIPKPGSLRYYYLFHFSNDTFNDARPKTLYYSLIDKEAGNGKGEVIGKNIPIIQHTPLRGGGMTACKHANGRDYWLVMGASEINRFYKFLITPDSIIGPIIEDIGLPFTGAYDLAYSKFSQDGSKYATGTFGSKIEVMDFDRCSGMFSNPEYIYHNNATDPNDHTHGSGSSGLEFSPNSRYLYICANIDLVQHDLWAFRIQDSVNLYWEDSTRRSGVNYLQLASNGKIYGCNWSGGGSFNFLHVINTPDEYGDSANFAYGGQPTKSYNSINLPNMINYKLGALIGSGCDTIIAGTPDIYKNESIRVQPVPADKYAYVEMPVQSDYELQLLNELGQLIITKQTRQVDIFDTEGLAAGVYFIRATDKHNSKTIAVRKITITH